ncbi:MAG: transposase, partial [Gemmataceae bacterium]|nr:transposase [Gemmataceae bacterium]
LAEPVLKRVSIDLPKSVPVIADMGYDSDPLRDRLAARGFELITPHRANRVRPPPVDERKLRRYRHRWIIERTTLWLPNFPRIVTRWEYHRFIYGGFCPIGLRRHCPASVKKLVLGILDHRRMLR